MEDDFTEAAILLRKARRLVEEAQPLVTSLPIAVSELELARKVLLELGGEYKDEEE